MRNYANLTTTTTIPTAVATTVPSTSIHSKKSIKLNSPSSSRSSSSSAPTTKPQTILTKELREENSSRFNTNTTPTRIRQSPSPSRAATGKRQRELLVTTGTELTTATTTRSSRQNRTVSDEEEDEDDDDDDEEDEDDDGEGIHDFSESCLTTTDDEDEEENIAEDEDDEIKPGLETISEEQSIRRRKDKKKIDDSTCCDEDFTWVRSEPPVVNIDPSSTSLQSNHHNHHNHQLNLNSNPSIIQSFNTNTTSGKPPRPSGSLDRRRNNTSSTNRQERDSKSRSTHSLKEKIQTNEFKDVSKGNQHDLSGYHQQDSSFHLHRGSPKFWDIPPPPPSVPYTTPWDQHYWNIQRSREELRMLEYHRRQQELYRYGSNGTLSNSQIDLYGGGCCQRYPPPVCCSCDHRPMISGNQRQDTDERLRRLQTDKESLTLQVQVLSEQVSAQSERINDLEVKLTEKTQLMNNIEDLLHREMLTRSSLETQKLELLSAMSDLKLKQAALERENLDIRSSHMNNNTSLMNRRPPLGPARLLTSTSSPLNSTPMHGSHGSLPQSGPSPITPKTPPTTSRRQVDHYSSLPRQTFPTTIFSVLSGPTMTSQTIITPPSQSSSTQSTPSPLIGQQNNSNNIITPTILVDTNANPKQRMVAFAETEKVIEDTTDLPRSYTPQPAPSPLLGQKKGLRGIFGKLKRSNSGNLEDLPMENGEFKRGGIRSTAGPRLGWSQNQQKPDTPFSEWDIESVCLWLDEIGLDAYENDARRWLKNGASELITASPVDIEKELNLKSPLHRKKIILAITEFTGNDGSDELLRNAGKLDMTWISKWLEDIGLPQYKDVFLLARLDGRMLHKLTMDDLNALHVTSMLHVASLRRAIQIMRENNWEPDCLIRRSSGDDNEKVSLWTAHRVMEWLEVIDLAEYTPNLRGAGVHGALMLYEPKFTSQLLAEMLSIPPNKTLLRRHLALHFSELIGRDIIQAKRDAENTLGYIPLTITAKIKTPKKSQFSLKRKKSTKGSGDEWSDYVCPMGSSGDHLLTTSNQNTITNTTTTTVSTMNPITQEIVAVSGVVSQQSSSDSPTSTRSSNSAS